MTLLCCQEGAVPRGTTRPGLKASAPERLTQSKTQGCLQDKDIGRKKREKPGRWRSPRRCYVVTPGPEGSPACGGGATCLGVHETLDEEQEEDRTQAGAPCSGSDTPGGKNGARDAEDGNRITGTWMTRRTRDSGGERRKAFRSVLFFSQRQTHYRTSNRAPGHSSGGSSHHAQGQ